MNRTIKFRAWDGKKMNYQPIVSDGTDGGETSRVMINEAIECFDYMLMQFTGLHDKNGKEIYEGDILNIGAVEFGFIKNEKDENVCYEVRHEGCDYILYRNDLKLKWGRLSRLEEMFWNCEVIGNIYKTPSKGGEDE